MAVLVAVAVLAGCTEDAPVAPGIARPGTTTTVATTPVTGSGTGRVGRTTPLAGGLPSGTLPVTPDRSATATPCPGPVPAGAGLDPFYTRYCDLLGIPLVSGAAVDPAALRVAEAYTRAMLAHRPDVARTLARSPVRIGVIGRRQNTTDMPEWSDLNQAFPDTNWDERARGLGATDERPLVGAGEENLLCLPEDRYLGESIFVHELSHTILQFGVQAVEPGFRERLVRAYDRAIAAGRWKGTYAATNVDEYWAEAVQSYFDTNLADDSQHNAVDTRRELAGYDPAVYRLVTGVFGADNWRPTGP